MTTIAVKPHPDLDIAAHKLIVHPVSGGLLDAAGQIPDDGRPWLYDGFTCRMLTDDVILRADDAAFAADRIEDSKADQGPVPTVSTAKTESPGTATKAPIQTTATH